MDLLLGEAEWELHRTESAPPAPAQRHEAHEAASVSAPSETARRLSGALKHLERAHAAAPDNLDVTLLLGQVWYRLGRAAMTVQAYAALPLPGVAQRVFEDAASSPRTRVLIVESLICYALAMEHVASTVTAAGTEPDCPASTSGHAAAADAGAQLCTPATTAGPDRTQMLTALEQAIQYGLAQFQRPFGIPGLARALEVALMRVAYWHLEAGRVQTCIRRLRSVATLRTAPAHLRQLAIRQLIAVLLRVCCSATYERIPVAGDPPLTDDSDGLLGVAALNVVADKGAVVPQSVDEEATLLLLLAEHELCQRDGALPRAAAIHGPAASAFSPPALTGPSTARQLRTCRAAPLPRSAAAPVPRRCRCKAPRCRSAAVASACSTPWPQIRRTRTPSCPSMGSYIWCSHGTSRSAPCMAGAAAAGVRR